MRFIALLSVVLIPSGLFGASLRSVSDGDLTKPNTAAVNQNFKNINDELSNTVHKTSTETIRGYKYFVDPVDFGTTTADGVTTSTITATSGTITGLSVSTITVTASTSLTGTFSLSGTWDGWIGSNETWTYAAGTQFTITGDLTGKYSVGDRIKLTQTTVKYFYITAVSFGSPNTTITVDGFSTYSLANAAITGPFYSKLQTPQGFPLFVGRGVGAAASAATGFVGEYIESVAGNTNAPATGVWGDLTSISLTAGDWDVTVRAGFYRNGATIGAGSDADIGVSATSGNSSTGLTLGDNFQQIFLIATSNDNGFGSIPNKRFSLSSTTTIYFKYRANYSAGTPQASGVICARRVF